MLNLLSQVGTSSQAASENGNAPLSSNVYDLHLNAHLIPFVTLLTIPLVIPSVGQYAARGPIKSRHTELILIALHAVIDGRGGVSAS